MITGCFGCGTVGDLHPPSRDTTLLSCLISQQDNDTEAKSLGTRDIKENRATRRTQ